MGNILVAIIIMMIFFVHLMISKGNKVKFTVKFKGREMQHSDLGKDLMTKIIEETKDVAKVESKPKFEGRQMVMIIQPL